MFFADDEDRGGLSAGEQADNQAEENFGGPSGRVSSGGSGGGNEFTGYRTIEPWEIEAAKKIQPVAPLGSLDDDLGRTDFGNYTEGGELIGPPAVEGTGLEKFLGKLFGAGTSILGGMFGPLGMVGGMGLGSYGLSKYADAQKYRNITPQQRQQLENTYGVGNTGPQRYTGGAPTGGGGGGGGGPSPGFFGEKPSNSSENDQLLSNVTDPNVDIFADETQEQPQAPSVLNQFAGLGTYDTINAMNPQLQSQLQSMFGGFK